MLKIYKRKNGESSSTRKMIRWFHENNIPYEILSPKDLTATVIRQMLYVSDSGFDSLLVSKKRSSKIKEKLECFDFNKLSTEALIQKIVAEPSLIRTPIAFDDKKLLVGYNSDEIRVFIPRELRDITFGEW
jgi:regulatory protein spx